MGCKAQNQVAEALTELFRIQYWNGAGPWSKCHPGESDDGAVPGFIEHNRKKMKL